MAPERQYLRRPRLSRGEERQAKLRLAHALNQIIARRRLTQAAAAELLGIKQPKVSALAYKLGDCRSNAS